MKTLPKTSTHLNVCGSNFFKLRKLLQDFEGHRKIFEKSISKNEKVLIKFNLLSKTKHTLTYEAKHIHPEDNLNDFVIRFCVFIDAKMVEVISFQGEKPFPFYVKNKSILQSSDEKHQQNTFFFDFLENLLTFAEEIIE